MSIFGTKKTSENLFTGHTLLPTPKRMPKQVRTINGLIEFAGKLNMEGDLETESKIWVIISELSLEYSQKLTNETT